MGNLQVSGENVQHTMVQPLAQPDQSTYCTGDFEMASSFHTRIQWGDEVSLCIEVGDIVYVNVANEDGWAHATRLSDDQQCWVPSSMFSSRPRYAYTAVQFYAGFPELNYCNVAVGDQVQVYHREADETVGIWAYGSVAHHESKTVVEGWFPVSVLMPAQVASAF